MIRTKNNRSGGLYCVGNVIGGIQLFRHPVAGGKLTIFSIVFVSGDILRISLVCIECNPSAAESNDGAPPSIPVDIFPFRVNLGKARFLVLADLTDKTLRWDYVLVFEFIIGASPSIDFRNALDSQDGRSCFLRGSGFLSWENEHEAPEYLLLALDQLLR